MKIYLVGGAVRDKLLNWPVKERDWVVVGATINDMLNLDYRQVGKDFPVFLHPKTHEEYALARMERKTAPGYKGFAFDTSPIVTLEDDLSRRDLTINAMAEASDGTIIDPFHGQADLEARLLSHVSPAFAEDPVRILRIGRFYARFAHLGFHIAPETIELMKNMVQAGEVNALVAERVWKELERALGEKNPEKFFEALDVCGALPILFPGLSLQGDGMKALITATTLSNQPIVRLAALLHNVPDAKKEICDRFKLPTAYTDLVRLTAANYEKAISLSAPKMPHDQATMADDLMKLFSRMDIYRREERFNDFLIACEAIASIHNQKFDSQWLNAAAHVALDIDIAALVAQGFTGQQMAEEIFKARLNKLSEYVAKNAPLYKAPD